VKPIGATIDEVLAAARERIRRYAPGEVPPDVVIIDIRSADARRRDGVIPGALHIPRTVLEWRVDPNSEWRTPQLTGTERLVVVCDHGYSSSLAAATLLQLGIDAGDMIGGFEAWVGAGLAVKPVGDPPPGLPGMGPPD
jgi:rhodanese-related sulfurtransferase